LQASIDGHIAARIGAQLTQSAQALLVTALARTTAAMAIRPTPHRPHRITELAMGRITGGYSYPTYSYPSYGYPAYGYGGYYRPGYRVARRVAIHRARWR
jgi:hypothetical protein